MQSSGIIVTAVDEHTTKMRKEATLNMFYSKRKKLLRKRNTAVIPNDHFYNAKTKSKQGVMAVWSLNLTFTEMLMHSGTMHSLCKTFILRWHGFLLVIFFVSFSAGVELCP